MRGSASHEAGGTRYVFARFFLGLEYSRTPVPPKGSSPSGGRLGGGFSLFDNAKVLIIWQPDKQVANPVRSEKWEKRKVTPSHRNGATFALE